MTKFIFSPDKHVGFQRTRQGIEPLHDAKAISAMLKFAEDFEPDTWIEGGDNLDYGPVSHWMAGQKKSIQGLDLSKDAKIYRQLVLDPVNKIMSRRSKSAKKKVWMIGNHEAWAYQFGEENPGAASLIDPVGLLDLEGWEIVEQGKHVQLGKLIIVHGDTLGTANPAKVAVDRWGHSIMFGHFHTLQIMPKHELIDVEQPKVGIAVPGLCNKNPNYGKNKPNQWMKGFAYGWIMEDGTFQVNTPVFINGRFIIDGEIYRG